MSTRHVIILVTLAMSMMLFVAQAQAALQTFDNKAAFLTATSANSASGPLPDLGIQTPEQATVGSVTFSVAPGGDNFFIGANNVTGLPSTDWYPPTPGNDIALGHENLQVQTAQPVFALGFDFVEPNVTVQPWGGRHSGVAFGRLPIGRTSRRRSRRCGRENRSEYRACISGVARSSDHCRDSVHI